MYAVRINIAIMCFMACLVSYMLRVNLSITILAMIVPRMTENDNDSNSTISLPDYGPRFAWTPYQESLLLGAFFWGYLVFSAPGGIFANWIGGRLLVGYSLIISALCTMLGPMVAEHFWLLFMTRVMIGLLTAPINPSIYYLIAHWAPPDEKGKFTASFFGNAPGTIISWSLLSLLIENVNWSMGFFVPAASAIVTAMLWFYIVSDSPANHPRIKANEIKYIQQSLADSLVTQKSAIPPILPLLKTLPFWSLMILHYGSAWGFYFYLTGIPKYMNRVLELTLSKTGVVSALPMLMRMLFGIVFGVIGDALLKENILSKTMIRKSFCIFSHIIPGVLLVILGYCGAASSHVLCITLITLSIGFSGAATMTTMQNPHDLSPNYCGTIFGFINFVASSSGFITPLVIAHFTEERSTSDEWNSIFLITAAFYILAGIQFMIFGSAKVQQWNNVQPNITDYTYLKEI